MAATASNRITRTYTQHINASADRVFPMLCPVREKDYLEDWNAEILHSESGVAELGCIFQTVGADGSKSLWLITTHDASAGKIEFAVYTVDSHISTLNIQLRSNDNGNSTFITFTYIHTAISEKGKAFIQKFTLELFEQKMANFEKSLNRYLTDLDG